MKNTGGPAFPQSAYLDGPTQEGMTLRDYFAAKAMQFCLAGSAPARARQAYEMADAMLAERVK